ncbi:Methyl-accepting chemotaxis protein PctB [Vibrio aerogenes CECT 7868]|uniref:Methyl-accepting chemotaxis protein PctB n=2 Tax=Gammaproteobacteria TaxID=1236 RepID=A0A1M5ZN10_9VIBR|nr:methyl-accepting chemotaxis protein [Vibrio aerogenes]SHI25572.1 Methyl-accepting chemotaxis protein PctB [Vibrio aerogenes CECT 7868]
MSKFSSFSIRKKMVLGLTFAVLASTMIVGAITQYQSREALRHRLVDIEFPSFLDQIRQQVDHQVQTLLQAARQIAHNEFVKSAISKNPIDADSERMLVRQLNNLKQQYHLNDASVANKETAHYWNQNGFLRQLKPGDASWFFDFIASGKPTMISLYQEKNGDIKMFANYQDTGGFTLSGMSKSLDDMVSLLNSFKIEESGFVFLTDAKGQIKIHKDKQDSGKSLTALFGQKAAGTLLDQSGFHLTEAEYHGEKVFLASEYIASMDWFIVAAVPESEVYADLDQQAVMMMVWTTVIAAVFILLSVWLAGGITRPIRQIAERFEQLGQGNGDLSQRIEVNGQDEIARLSCGFNAFIETIHQSMIEVSSTSRTLAEEAQLVSEKAHHTHNNSQDQRDQTIQVVTAMNEMGATIHEIASNAGMAAQTATDASALSDVGYDVVNQTRSAINLLAEDMANNAKAIEKLATTTQDIGSILNVIRDISEQTNLLALNAAIEAARAGDQGRGFAVVADEVRQLAGRTASSTDEIQTIISQLQNDAQLAVTAIENGRQVTQHGVELSESAATQLSQITESIHEISDRNTQVATATEEQSTTVQSINQNIEEINTINETTTATAQELATASIDLKQLSERLDQLVGQFKL